MAETIKDFLVSLGFKVDSGGLNKFKNGIATATKAVTTLGAALTVTAALITKFVSGTAKEFNHLADLSKNTGVSVQKIQELGYIASLTGSNVEAVATSLTNLNKTVGEASLGIGKGAATFNQLGISAKKQNGELKTTEDLLDEISQKIKTVSASERTAILSKLGVDATLIGALTEDVSELREEFTKLYSSVGIDSGKAAASSAQFIDSITRLKFVFDTLKNAIALQFLPKLKNGMDTLRKLMVENSKKIIETITPILKFLLKLVEAFFILVRRVGNGIGKLIDIFKIINKATGGWAGYILAAVAAWKLFNMAFLASPVGRLILLGTALALLVDDFLGYNEGLRSAIDWGNTFNKVLLALTVALGAFRIAMMLAIPGGPWVKAILAIISLAFVFVEEWRAVKEWFKGFFSWMTTGFEKLGSVISKAVEAVKGKFNVDDTGEAKLSRDAFAQSTRKLSSFGSVGGQNLMSGGATKNFTQSINQETKITIDGSRSPEATAKAIYNEQARVNADMTRNFAGAIR